MADLTTESPADDPRLWGVSPLSFLSEQDRSSLLALSRAVSLKQGQQVVRQGRYPAELLIPLNGRLKRVSAIEGGNADAGEIIEAYQSVGIECLVQGSAYPYSVFAAEDATVRVVPWKDLQPLIRQIPGLEAYLRLVSQSSALRDLDMTLDEMGCTPSFRAALVGGMKFESIPPDAWIGKQGEVPGFMFYCVTGSVQAFAKVREEELKPLWMAPNLSWQLFESCLNKAALTHHLKAISRVDLYKLPLRTIETLREAFPKDFEAFERLALRREVENEEEEEGGEVENLEDLFPAPPKATRSLRFTYPWVQQNDEMDCGPACMAMISKYYGNDLPIQFWRARMSTNQEGTSLFDLASASEKVGFVSHGVSVDNLTGLEPQMFPLVALRRYHYFVVYHVDRSGLTVGDPAIGVRRMSHEEFKKGFDGYVLLLRPTEQFYQEKAPDRGYGHYAAMFKGQGFELFLILVTSLMLTLLQMIPAFLSQFIIDSVLARGDLQLLLLAIVAAAVVTGMIGVISWLRSYYLAFVTARFDFAALSAFMRKLFSLPYDFFSTRHVGDFSRRIAEMQRVREFVTGKAVETVLSFLNLLVYGIALFKYNPTVAVAVYLSAPALVGISILFSKRMRLQYGEVFSRRADQEGMIADIIKGMSTIKTLGAEVASRWRYEEALVNTLRVMYDFSLTAAALNGLSTFLNQTIRFSVMGLAAYMALKGQMTPGQVVAVSVLTAGIIGPFDQLAHMWAEVQELRTVLDRLNDVFLAESESRPDKRALIKQRLRGEIEFREVWFRYGGEDSDWVLKGMSFHILPGQSVAIVGASGGGKSTMALLTARLYEPTKGTILIDGRDYREYDRQWLRRQIGLLLQETNLFHGTLLENIAYGDPRPDMGRVEAVAEAADAKAFIEEKSTGYDYRITHGGLGLSGGQKQRISIARILYASPTILFMDEATSSLDANSERAIGKALKEASKNRTVINIAHRYNTVKLCDFVLVIDGGRVVEFGTHAELKALGGFYSKLFADQF
jgi:subfamily B ATP-binding cassette protein HlyB/CyaB